MAGSIPDGLVLKRHRDFDGRRLERLVPQAGLLIFCALPVLALMNVFGQSPVVKTVSNPNGVVTMQLSAPTAIRSGDIFQARFDIRAHKQIKDAVLVFDSGWLESITMNTAEPGASSETSRNGGIAFDLGNIPAGKLWRQYLQLQPNPVNAGPQSQGVTLYDGNVPLLHLNRSLMIWP